LHHLHDERIHGAAKKIRRGDAALTNGIIVRPVTTQNSLALSSDWGDLTSTIVLPPCIGASSTTSSLHGGVN